MELTHARSCSLLLQLTGRGEKVHPPLQLVHDAPHVLVAGVRDDLDPRLHILVVVGRHDVHPTSLSVERDLEGVLSLRGHLYAARLEDYEPQRFLVLLLLEVEKEVALQHEPSPLKVLAEVAAFLEVAFLVDGRGTGRETRHVLFVEFHTVPRAAVLHCSPLLSVAQRLRLWNDLRSQTSVLETWNGMRLVSTCCHAPLSVGKSKMACRLPSLLKARGKRFLGYSRHSKLVKLVLGNDGE